MLVQDSVTGANRSRLPKKIATLFTSLGQLLCSGLVVYSSMVLELAAARGLHQGTTEFTRRGRSRDVAAASNDPLYCAASKAEAEATPIKDRAVVVQTIKNRAKDKHKTICAASRQGFAPGQPPSPTAWAAARNVLYGADDLVPPAFKKVSEFRSPQVPVLKNFRLKGSVVPHGNVYYVPK